MPWLDVIWTDENEGHVAEHGLTRQQVEYVLRNARRDDESHTTDRPISLGKLPDGRTVAIVYEWVDAITAYEVKR